MSDERLREAYARALAARAPAERAACPAPEALLALVRREGDEDARLAMLDHVMACAACHEEFELLRALERAGHQAAREEAGRAAAERTTSAAGRVVGHIRWRRWAPLAAAAAVLLAVALGPGRRLWERAPEPVRGAAEAIALIAPEDGYAPSRPAITFAWHVVPGAENYVVELLTSGGAVAVRGTTAAADTMTTLLLPPTLGPGDYRWWVIATAADGSETRSGMRALRLRGR